MQGKIVFGKWESVCLLINMINTQIFLSFPRIMLETGQTAGWLVSIYIFVLALLGFALVSRLFKRFPGMDIIDISCQLAGRIGQTLVSLVLFSVIVFITSITLREFSEDMKTITLVNSPLIYVMMFFIIGMIASAFLGIETILRLHAVAVPVIAAGFLLILLLLSPQISLENIFPLFGGGASQILGGGFVRVSMYTALLIIFFLPPFIKSFDNFKSAGYTALFFSGFFMTISVFILLTVQHYPPSVETSLPIYSMSRLIDLGRFFQRIEPIFVIIWAFAALLYLGSGLYFSAYVFKKAFNLQYIRPLILPLVILIVNIAFLPESAMSAVWIETEVIRVYGFLVTFGLPLLMLLAAWLLKKKCHGDGSKPLKNTL